MEITIMKLSVVTTFHQAGYETYGKRMIETFLQTWPADVTLYVYAENCQVTETAPNLVVRDLEESSPALVNFKNTWKNVPKANGDVSNDPIRSKRKDAGKGFKWHAIRFAHKVYSIFHCAENCDADVLMWMDADTICHSPINQTELENLIPQDIDLCYLGRRGKYSECGLYAMRLHTKATVRFLREFQRVYDEAENGIFLLEEWHDSFVFDAVRVRIPGIRELNWSASLGDLRAHKGNSLGEGHPLINCEWGEYLDHLKGDRKDIGRSAAIDLKVPKKSKYWSNI
jgi:hypothetical protein